MFFTFRFENTAIVDKKNIRTRSLRLQSRLGGMSVGARGGTSLETAQRTGAGVVWRLHHTIETFQDPWSNSTCTNCAHCLHVQCNHQHFAS